MIIKTKLDLLTYFYYCYGINGINFMSIYIYIYKVVHHMFTMYFVGKHSFLSQRIFQTYHHFSNELPPSYIRY